MGVRQLTPPPQDEYPWYAPDAAVVAAVAAAAAAAVAAVTAAVLP